MAGTRRQRLISGSAMVIALVPLVYSLNRGVWIGVGLAACYLAVRMAARGKLGLLTAILAGIAIVGVAVLATPLHGVISQRLQNGKSNDLRATLSAVAMKDALASPVLGYGDTRQEVGSPSSIAIGPTANCGSCGETPVGGNGQLWLLLICNGIVGAALYLAFFAFGCWRYWRDTSPYGMAGVLILLLSFVYMFTYVAVIAPLGFTMLAYALLWRNDLARQLQAASRRTRRKAWPTRPGCLRNGTAFREAGAGAAGPDRAAAGRPGRGAERAGAWSGSRPRASRAGLGRPWACRAGLRCGPGRPRPGRPRPGRPRPGRSSQWRPSS